MWEGSVYKQAYIRSYKNYMVIWVNHMEMKEITFTCQWNGKNTFLMPFWIMMLWSSIIIIQTKSSLKEEFQYHYSSRELPNIKAPGYFSCLYVLSLEKMIISLTHSEISISKKEDHMNLLYMKLKHMTMDSWWNIKTLESDLC